GIFFFQAEDGIRDFHVTGVQTCALPIYELGVRLSCDDFGTGYSSLAHLRRLPISEIKIDKQFVASMTVDESDRAIARSVLALGRSEERRVGKGWGSRGEGDHEKEKVYTL